MRLTVYESNIIPACILVFLFYFCFIFLIGAAYPPHAAWGAVLLSASLPVEYMLLASMLRNVYDKHYLFFRNALSVFIGICCAYFILRGFGTALPTLYTLFAVIPIATVTIRRNRPGTSRKAIGPSGKAAFEHRTAARKHLSPDRQLELDKQAAFSRYTMHIGDAPTECRLAARQDHR